MIKLELCAVSLKKIAAFHILTHQYLHNDDDDDDNDDDDDDDDDDNNNNNNNNNIIRDNEKGTCMLIDAAISGDKNVKKKKP